MEREEGERRKKIACTPDLLSPASLLLFYRDAVATA